MRRWSIEHVVALVQLLCGLGFLAFALLTWAPFDSWPLGAFVAVATAGFAVWAWTTWRRAGRGARSAPAPPTAPTTPRSALPTDLQLADPATTPSRAAPTSDPPPTSASPADPPQLDADGERELARVVAVLAAEGVFAPRTPNPADLAEATADGDRPITADVVLMAMEEASYYHPGFRLEEHAANLALHDSHTEQFADTLRDQVDDLLRLAGRPALPVDVEERAGHHRLTIAGEVIEYAGAVKWLSTVLHVALAARLRTPERRLAWLWCDAGVWLTALPDGAVDRLNAALGDAAGEGWEWVDEQQPVAAGEPISRP